MLISNSLLLIAFDYIILICLAALHSAVNHTIKGGVALCQMPNRWMF